jgi:lipopolysaccharide transport system ATP-binding protein
MSNIAVSVEGLGKRYHIGKLKPGDMDLREAIYHGFKSPFTKTWSLLHGKAYGAAQLEEELWALRSVSFEVGRGETLGVIGHNGAGKSTLLRVLTRITEPNEGMAIIRGRAGALLEVGTGIHPELTGRENIFLNGSILGMRRWEVKKKFDEIVDFAGIEKFLDTPMKHYSDGMRVRLAFSVAAHLEPEVLLVDEVLAVGDASFQKKCLGKMGEVIEEGRTVLFVSHNMVAIRELCPRAILLDGGAVVYDGPSDVAIAKYLVQEEAEFTPVKGKFIQIVRTYFDGADRSEYGITYDHQQPLICGVELQVEKAPDRLWLNLVISTVDGTRLVHIRNDFDSFDLKLEPGRTMVEVKVDALPLLPDSYNLMFRLVSEFEGHQIVEDSSDLPLIIAGPRAGLGRFQAYVRTHQAWSTERTCNPDPMSTSIDPTERI